MSGSIRKFFVYILPKQGVFNNGTTDLKETAKFFEERFDIDLGQFHITFFEKRARKSERTKFLNSLRHTLVKRMERWMRFSIIKRFLKPIAVLKECT